MIDEDDPTVCKQCHRAEADEDGFCSDYCMKRYDFELSQSEYDGDGISAYDLQQMEDD